MKQTLKSLTELGLSEGEIKVYFALLELETSSVGPIIEKARVPDSKIYMILEKLKEKGLASFVIKNNVKHYSASSPKDLLRILNEKSRSIEDQKSNLQNNIIPEIEKRQKSKEQKPDATVYEGLEGLKSAFNYLLDTLDSQEEYYSFTFAQELENPQVLTFLNNYHNKREEKKVKVKFIAPREKKSVINKRFDYKLINSRFTDKKFPIGTLIFKDHVMTIVWEDKPTAFIIKSKKNYEYYKSFFEEIWKTAQK